MPENENDRAVEPIPSEVADQKTPLPATYEMMTYPADFTLEILVNKFNKKEIHIPPIQRRFVWNQTQSSRLIESFLLGLPVPPVYFYEDPKDRRLLVVDGQQRLRSITYFFSGLFGDPSENLNSRKKLREFDLTGLNDQSPYLGETFASLKETNQPAFNKLNNSVLRSFVMKQLKPEDDTSIFQIFERLNTGGVVLQGQEIRNCIYEGPFNDLLAQLNKNADWREIFGTKHFDKRMRDIELILRFFALFHNVRHYEKPMKKFLNDYMSAHRRSSSDKLEEFRVLFTNTAANVVKILGKKPFHISRGLNAAVYDSVFTAFAREGVRPSKDSVPSRFKRLLKDQEYVTWISSATTDKDVVGRRIDKAQEILFS